MGEVRAILNETSMGCQDRAELPLLAAHRGEEEDMVWVSTTHVSKEEMHVIDWAEAQNERPHHLENHRVDKVQEEQVPQVLPG